MRIKTKSKAIPGNLMAALHWVSPCFALFFFLKGKTKMKKLHFGLLFGGAVFTIVLLWVMGMFLPNIRKSITGA